MRIYLLAIALAAPAGLFADSWPPPNVSGLVEYAPKPVPQPGLHGSGIFVVRVHIPSGRVTDVGVAYSTGSDSLDRSAVAALRRWRFKAGALPPHKTVVRTSRQTRDETFIKIPITFQ